MISGGWLVALFAAVGVATVASAVADRIHDRRQRDNGQARR
jgi:hypothetical protein